MVILEAKIFKEQRRGTQILMNDPNQEGRGGVGDGRGVQEGGDTHIYIYTCG